MQSLDAPWCNHQCANVHQEVAGIAGLPRASSFVFLWCFSVWTSHLQKLISWWDLIWSSNWESNLCFRPSDNRWLFPLCAQSRLYQPRYHGRWTQTITVSECIFCPPRLFRTIKSTSISDRGGLTKGWTTRSSSIPWTWMTRTSWRRYGSQRCISQTPKTPSFSMLRYDRILARSFKCACP